MQGGVLEPQTGVMLWTIAVFVAIPVVLAVIIGLIVRAVARSRNQSPVVASLQSEVAHLELALHESENRVLELAERAVVAEQLLERRTERTSSDRD